MIVIEAVFSLIILISVSLSYDTTNHQIGLHNTQPSWDPRATTIVLPGVRRRIPTLTLPEQV